MKNTIWVGDKSIEQGIIKFNNHTKASNIIYHDLPELLNEYHVLLLNSSDTVKDTLIETIKYFKESFEKLWIKNSNIENIKPEEGINGKSKDVFIKQKINSILSKNNSLLEKINDYLSGDFSESENNEENVIKTKELFKSVKILLEV